MSSAALDCPLLYIKRRTNIHTSYLSCRQSSSYTYTSALFHRRKLLCSHVFHHSSPWSGISVCVIHHTSDHSQHPYIMQDIQPTASPHTQRSQCYVRGSSLVDEVFNDSDQMMVRSAAKHITFIASNLKLLLRHQKYCDPESTQSTVQVCEQQRNFVSSLTCVFFAGD